MKLCVINAITKVCENIIVADSGQDFVPYKQDIELAPDHTGEIGWVWNGTSWYDPNKIELTSEQRASLARRKRNNLLKQSIDSINPLRWESFNEEEKEQWMSYRQALLDIPQQEGFPDNIIWPVKSQ